MTDATEHYETIEGCKTQYLRGGKGPTVLFLHGGGGAGIWFPFFNALSEHYDVVMPGTPGVRPQRYAAVARQCGRPVELYFQFIKKLGLKDIHLIGNSLGGWLAADMAVRNSTPFKSLTLITAAGIHVHGVAKGDLFPVVARAADAQLFHNQAIPEALLKAPVNEEERRRQMKNSLSLAKLTWQPRLYDPHLQKWLHRIDIPTLICGATTTSSSRRPMHRHGATSSPAQARSDQGLRPRPASRKSRRNLAVITKHIAGVK